jgi:hypothetical protein
MPKEEFRREVEKELTGKDSEPAELIYFKVYKSQIPVIEQAIETAALMLGSDKSRGYCLEMICADFLAGANIDGSNPELLLQSISRYYKFLLPIAPLISTASRRRARFCLHQQTAIFSTNMSSTMPTGERSRQRELSHLRWLAGGGWPSLSSKLS